MYTQCTKCKHQRNTSSEELHATLGKIRCEACATLFDALELLNLDGFIEPEKEKKSIPKIKRKTHFGTFFWSLGYSLCLLLFIFQVYYFEGYNLAQNATIRPWLLKVCSQFTCQLPIYKNLDEFSILHGSFEPIDNDIYIFKTSFTNQSSYVQNYPSIKLTLINFTGRPFAERIFHPQDYAKRSHDMIQPDMSAEITMKLVEPSKSTGGYRFELI